MADQKFNPTIIEEGLGTVAIAGSIMTSPLLRPWRVFTDPIDFVMERKMLQGIRVRAEAGASN